MKHATIIQASYGFSLEEDVVGMNTTIDDRSAKNEALDVELESTILISRSIQFNNSNSKI